MLFVNGDRDSLADLELLRSTVADLGGRATLHVVSGGDHSFRVPKCLGGSAAEVQAEIATTVAEWGARIVGPPRSRSSAG